MKKIILKLLCLEDNQFRSKTGKINGWILASLGTAICIFSIVFYVSSMSIAEHLGMKSHESIQKVKADSNIPQDNRNVKQALNMIDTLSECPKVSVKVMTLFISVIGIFCVLQGILYLRVNNILNITNLNNADGAYKS